MQTEEEVFREFLSTVQLELKQYLQVNDRNVTSRSSNSLQLKEVTDAGGKLVGASHIEEVFLGRGPGTMPPISAIREWCYNRGIPRAAAWPIAKRIKEEGTRLFKELSARGFNNNAISVATRKELVDKMLAKIMAIYRSKITTDLRAKINA